MGVEFAEPNISACTSPRESGLLSRVRKLHNHKSERSALRGDELVLAVAPVRSRVQREREAASESAMMTYRRPYDALKN